MNIQFDELLGKVTDFIKSEANTKTVIGESFKLGDFSCVPVIKIGMGFGSGGGEGTDPKRGKGEGAGAGAGIGIEPVGFLVTKGDNISFLTAEKSKGIAAAFEKVPGLIEKFMENKKAEKETAKA